MKPRTLIALVVIGVLAIAGGWYFGTARQPGEQQAYNGGKLMFPDLAAKLAPRVGAGVAASAR